MTTLYSSISLVAEICSSVNSYSFSSVWPSLYVTLHLQYPSYGPSTISTLFVSTSVDFGANFFASLSAASRAHFARSATVEASSSSV